MRNPYRRTPDRLIGKQCIAIVTPADEHGMLTNRDDCAPVYSVQNTDALYVTGFGIHDTASTPKKTDSDKRRSD